MICTVTRSSLQKWYRVQPTTRLCTVLYCTKLHCTALHCTALHCTVLYCTVLHCTALHCTALHCTLLYSTLLYSTLLYSTLLYSTLLYSTLLYSTLLYSTLLHCTVMHYTVMHCTVMCRTYHWNHGSQIAQSFPWKYSQNRWMGTGAAGHPGPAVAWPAMKEPRNVRESATTRRRCMAGKPAPAATQKRMFASRGGANLVRN